MAAVVLPQMPCIGFRSEINRAYAPVLEIKRGSVIKLSALKISKWIINVYNSLVGPVLECEGGAGLHFLFKCFKRIKVSTLGKYISVTMVQQLSQQKEHTSHVLHTHNTFSLTLSWIVLPSVTMAHKAL